MTAPDLAAALADGRAAAEARMSDTCVARRRQDPDPDSGATSVTRIDVYTGPCEVQQQGTAPGQALDTGQEAVLVQRVQVKVPISAPGLQVGDEITITASVHDPQLVGRVFVVHDPAAKTHATARRVGVHARTR